MNFKRIEMNGFKSFADPVTIEFTDGITCIVGPNGSGKSNISDAIRWVLGEQAPKMLRGGKMDDVIFAGTQNRKSKGMAEVTLVIDNQDHTLPIDYAEVGITRRMYRSGESEYLINNNPCRLRDIKELIMDTGIGVEGYSIIGQGRIADIIDNKLDSRREIFEEAAGITKYRTKKQEAERKLERTNNNLTRVNDIVGEIEGRIGTLEKESEKAKEYLEIRDKYKDVEINIILKNIEAADQKTAVVREELKELVSMIQKDEEERASLEGQLHSQKEVADKYEAQLNQLRDDLLAKNDEIHEISGRGEVNKERLVALTRDEERLSGEITAIGEKLAKENENLLNAKAIVEGASDEEKLLDEEYRQKHQAAVNAQEAFDIADSKLNAKKDEILAIATKLSNAKASADSIEGIKQSLIQRSQRLNEEEGLEEIKARLEKEHALAIENKEKAQADFERASNSSESAKVSIGMLKARHNLLDELEKSYEGYGGGVKFLMSKNLNGIIGTLGDLLEVPRGLEVAIETVLGAKLQDIVCKNDDVAKNSIRLLKENKAGRLTFLPVDSLRVNRPLDTSKIASMNGFKGLASEKVGIKGGYKNVVEYMLGNVVVVDTIDDAIAISKKNAGPYKLVTIDGEVINAAGAITGGSLKNNTANILSRKAEKDDIEVKLEEAKKQLSDSEAAKEEAYKRNTEAESIRVRTENELQGYSLRLDEFSDIVKEIKNTEEKIAPMLELVASIEKEKQDADAMITGLTTGLEDARKVLSMAQEEESKARMAQNAAELKTSSAKEFLAMADQSINELNLNKEEKQKQLESAKLQKQQIADFEGGASQLLADKEAEKKVIEDKLSEVMTKRAEAKEAVDKSDEEKVQLDKRLYEHQVKKNDADVRMARFDTQTENLKEKLFEEFEMSYAEAATHEDPDFVMSRALKESREYKSRLRALGDVNVGAIEEYKQTKERYDFLTTQRADITKAIDELLSVIKEMDTIIKSKFQESFDTVAVNFEETFNKLFKGGHARLSMADPTNPLETAIEIEAQPPGKKLQNMNLLSGGEKTVTAIALMFAVLKAKPTPFCILDEIEAALDETNIDGVARYIKSFGNTTQFALITHQKLTMEYANVLYGVTMPEHGISQVLSLKLGDDFEVE